MTEPMTTRLRHGAVARRARLAGALVTGLGVIASCWLARGAYAGLRSAGGSQEVISTAFLVALTGCCLWFSLLTAQATMAVATEGGHLCHTQLHNRLVRRMAATLLLVAGGSATNLIPTAQAVGVHSAARTSTPAPLLMATSTSAPHRDAGGATQAPDPAFAHPSAPATQPTATGSAQGTQGWLPAAPPSSSPSDGSLLTGTPRSTGEPGEVIVHQGDSLWTIISRHIGGNADAATIAREVPRWYDANRATIGADPDLLRPGQVLHVPGAAR